MNENLTRYLEDCRRTFRQIKDQVQRHWKKGLFVALAMYIFTQKDVDIAVQLEGTEATESVAGEQPGFFNSVGSFFSGFLSGDGKEEEGWGRGYSKPQNTSMFARRKTKTGSRFTSFWGDGDDEPANDEAVDPETARIRAEKIRKQRKYVREYITIARRQRDEFNIPVSIILAQGLLESDAGDSRLATKNNNHFGLKCFSKSCKKGHCSNFADDHHKDFFRIFRNPEESYHAHSALLLAPRYKHLFQLDPDDYPGWAYGLKKAGYATDKQYAEKLINLIEELELYRYD